MGKLIDECQTALAWPVFTDEHLKTLTVLFTLVLSLKNLWLKGKSFTIQLRAMNTGQYEYGQQDPALQHFFKDFEYEIFCASHLNHLGISVELPQDTAGEDIVSGSLDIQCKHPSTTNQVEDNIRDFATRLNASTRYGIFGMALDDCMNYGNRLSFRDEEDLHQYFHALSAPNDRILQGLFNGCVARATRVLGVFTTVTFFIKLDNVGLRLIRLTNSAFCFRPDRREITDDLYREAYKTISKFNPQPSWLTIEKQRLITIN